MYKYEDASDYTREGLLEKYGQEAIFSIVFKSYPEYGVTYLSPFRPDRHPSCFFDWYGKTLLFRDYGDIRRDCFHAVKDYFNLGSYYDTFVFIHEHFKGKKVEVGEYERKGVKEVESVFHDIPIEIREWTDNDNKYWKMFFITYEQLFDDLVFPISLYRVFSKKSKSLVAFRPFKPAYAITGFARGKKIYIPDAPKDKRWITNCVASDIGNIENIDFTMSYLIITKSYKDHRVIRNEGYPNTVWFQSEKIIPPDERLIYLLMPFPIVFIFYDNDKAGIEGSEKLKQEILRLFPDKKIVLIYSPFRIFKDPAEIVETRGRKDLSDLLWNSFHQ